MIDLQEFIQAWVGMKWTLLHHAFHSLPNRWELDAMFEKCLDGHLVCGIERRRQRAADFPGAAREIKRGKIASSRGFKIKTPKRCQIERAQAVRDALRPGHRVLNGKAHVRMTKLREQRTVHKLHHRMHDALRMDDHVHFLHRNVE